MSSSPLTEWSRLLIGSLARSGIRHAVISPGSRSTPLTTAALSCPELECHSVIDERSAAFFALGQVRLTGRPILLVCTSGSAAAHYFPAVIEASESQLPLVILSADRPFELAACGASQTIDQTRLYGDFARLFLDLGMPDGEPSALRALQRKAAQAVLASQAPKAGPVQLNFRARKPLEPSQPTSDAERRVAALVSELLEVGPAATPVPELIPSRATLERLAWRLTEAERPLLVVGRRGPSRAEGPDAPAPLALARTANVPLVCEAASQLRFQRDAADAVLLDAFDPLFKHTPPEAAPDFVLELGAPLTSGAWAAYAKSLPAGTRVVVTSGALSDPQNGAAEIALGDPDETARRLTALLGDRGAPTAARSGWSRLLSERNESAWRAIETILDEDRTELSEARAVRAFVEALPRATLLGIGNSLAIREIDWVCQRGAAEIDVWVQRGAAGIDGLIAGAAGACHASQRPSALLLGDVSALHDVGSLAVARDVPHPLLIAVVDNGGGRIFEHLPYAEHASADSERFRYWTTPPRIDWEAAAQAFGVRHALAATEDELQLTVREALARPGATLLRIPVIPQSSTHFTKRVGELLRSSSQARAQ